MRQFPTRLLALAVSATALTYASEAVAQQQQQQRAQTTPAPSAPTAAAAPKQDSMFGPDWKVTLGVGGLVGPAYMGADSYKVRPLPFVDVTWRNTLFLTSANGLGVYVLNNPNYKLGTSVNLSPGRDSGDDDRLKGMKTIDMSAEAKIFGSYTLGPIEMHGDVRRRFGDVDGFLATAGVNYRMTFSPKLFLSAGPSVTWGDKDYTNGFFGITPTEAANARSNHNNLTAYKADAGFRDVSFNMMGRYQIDENWGVGMMAKISQLLGDAADSPLTEKKLQPSAGLFVAYKF